jgi:preprotein translocase SecE subunit
VARDRQRSKQRQAERRARRLEQQGAEAPPDLGGPAVDPELAVGAPPEEEGRTDFVVEGEHELLDHDDSAPPEARSDPILGDQPGVVHDDSVDDAPPASEEEAMAEIEDWEVAHRDSPDYAKDFAEDDMVDGAASTGEGESGYAVKGRRGRADHEAHRDRPRVVQFLIAVWAELQRVQWPNRQAMVTLTGVVLGFVLIAGGYLGLLDAVFSELIQAIL